MSSDYDEKLVEEKKKVNRLEQQLDLADAEIARLKSELKLKENFIESLLRPIYDKILKEEKEVEEKLLPKLLLEIKEDVVNALKRSRDNAKLNGTLYPSRAEKVLIKKAVIDAQSKPIRQKNVIVNFKQLPGQFMDQFINEVINICESHEIASFKPAEQFRWVGKHQSTLIMKFESRDTAINVLKTASKIQKSEDCYRDIRIRQDYSPSELKLFRHLWSEANERNNKAGFFEWTVKHFRVVKATHPGPWLYRPFIEQNYDYVQ